MEHSEVYRGEHGYVPWFGQILRRTARKRVSARNPVE
jgi:hypothetical protein